MHLFESSMQPPEGYGLSPTFQESNNLKAMWDLSAIFRQTSVMILTITICKQRQSP